MRGAKQDTKLWFHYAQKAAQAGQDTARALVATIIGVGNAELGVVANPAEGFKVLTEACARQSAYACFQLGEFYQAGLGTKRDLSKAIELFEKVQAHSPASNGVPLSLEIERPKAAFELAKLFASDDGVHQNKARARIKLLESINFPGPRFTDAWLEYAQALIVPTTAYEFPSTDIKRGIEILTWFGERNTAKALDLLGNLYLTGKHGVPKDPAKAISLLEKAASLNYPLAMIRLAGYYVDQNAEGEKVAFGWVEKAANLGDPLGTWRLALHYRDGMGVSKDMGKYQRAIAKACDLKNVAACNELGDSYMKAKDGFPKDIGIAREVLKRADEQDSPRAALLLSLAYLGANAKTEEDVFAGVRYAFIAKERGAEHAEALLEQIAGATRPVMQKAYAQIKEEFK